MKAFDKELYIKNQTKEILKRSKMFDKLYLEIGGKLFDDDHAKRCLPGFSSNTKLEILENLKDDLEIILCIKAIDIERNKKRFEYNITYEDELLRIITNLLERGFSVNSVVITLYNGEKSAKRLIKRLKNLGINTYTHQFTKGYPNDIETIVSEKGYGANSFIETSKKIICVSGAGASSGKLATCLSQLYHENRRKTKAGYAKFETFPVYNLSLTDPLNLAYEAATANLGDENMIDYYHLEAYKQTAINYNRDLSVFPILKDILFKITKKEIYKSPTDMGINMIKSAIVNKEEVDKATSVEILRRYYKELINLKMGEESLDALNKIKYIMSTLKIDDSILPIINAARRKAKQKKSDVVAIEVDGKIITGKETELLSASSTLLINSLKELTQIPDEIDLLSQNILEPILKIKNKKRPLSLNEVLIALAITSVTNPTVKKAMDNLELLKGCNAHATYILSDDEKRAFQRFQIELTCDPIFKSSYYK